MLHPIFDHCVFQTKEVRSEKYFPLLLYLFQFNSDDQKISHYLDEEKK